MLGGSILQGMLEQWHLPQQQEPFWSLQASPLLKQQAQGVCDIVTPQEFIFLARLFLFDFGLQEGMITDWKQELQILIYFPYFLKRALEIAY